MSPNNDIFGGEETIVPLKYAANDKMANGVGVVICVVHNITVFII